MTSAPACSTARRRSSDVVTSGWPAVTYATSALRPDFFSDANRSTMGETLASLSAGTFDSPGAGVSDEIVADPHAEAVRILGLDDRAQKHAVLTPRGEVDRRAGVLQVSHRIADDAHDGTGE